MENNILRQIIIISGIVVYLMGEIDGDAAILQLVGILGLAVLATAEELIIIYIGVDIVTGKQIGRAHV